MACILAVDDDEAIRNLLGRVLGKDGHDVRLDLPITLDRLF